MHEYDVGFGKPPSSGKFKPGQTGNPKGRPKGSQNIASILDRVSKERVMITENGKTIKLSKKEIAIRQMITKAAKGDLRAFAQYMALVQQSETAQLSRAAPSHLTLNPQMQEVLRQRMRLQAQTLVPTAEECIETTAVPVPSIVDSTGVADD